MIVSNAIRQGLRKIRGPGVVAQIVRGTGIAFVLTALGQALNAVLQIVLARVMGRVEYGTYIWVTAWVPTLVVPLALGLPQAAVRFLPEYAAQGNLSHRKGFVLFSQALVLGVAVLASALATTAFLLIPSVRESPLLCPMLVAVWMVPVASQIGLLSQLCRALRRITLAFGPMRVVMPAILMAAVIGLYELGHRPKSALVLAISLGTMGLMLAVQMAVFRRDFAREAISEPPRYDARRWLSVALPLMLMAACQTLFCQVDVLTVGALRGPRDVAVYGAANRLVSLVEFVLLAANVALGPEAAELYARGEKALLQKAVTATVRMAFWPALAATIGLIGLGRLVLLLYGHAYVAGYGAMCILAMGSLVSAASGPVLLLLNMTGFERISIRVLGVTALLDIALNIALVQRYGYFGAAVASAATLALWNIWLAMLAKRHLGIDSFIGFAR